jgi:hypothetical protein
MLNRKWFEMVGVRSPSRGAASVPLRRSERSTRAIDSVEVEEFVGIATLAVETAQEVGAEKLGFGNGLGLDAHRPEADEKRYVPADVVISWGSGATLGTPVVLAQDVEGFDKMIWSLHQDLVIALGLVREGDVWRRPAEGWADVARLRRDHEGSPVLLEMKAEFLSD